MQRRNRNVVIDIAAAKESVLIKTGVGPEQGVVRVQADPAFACFPFCLHCSLVGRLAHHWQAER